MLDRPDAIVLALASRVIMTVADLLLAGVGAVSMRGVRRDPAEGVAASTGGDVTGDVTGEPADEDAALPAERTAAARSADSTADRAADGPG